MLTGAVVRAAWRLPIGVPTEPGALREVLRHPPAPPPDGWWRVADPSCPASVAAPEWRRTTRLARLALQVVDELRAGEPDVDWERIPFVYGSAMGEVVPSSQFLDRLIAEGPKFASAFAFQNSVYNATPGHVGHLFGLQGPTETLSAGMATGLAALARGMEHLADAPHALVLVGDDLNPTTEAALGGGGGEAMVGVLLARGAGPTVRDGDHGGEASRARALPYERGFVATGAPIALERALGVCSTNGLVALLAGLSVVDRDADLAFTGAP